MALSVDCILLCFRFFIFCNKITLEIDEKSFYSNILN